MYMIFHPIFRLYDRMVTREALRMDPSTPGSMYYPMPAPIEDQFDAWIHATQVNERYAAGCITKSDLEGWPIAKYIGQDQPCGYCGTANDPEIICKTCWDSMP